MSTRISLPANTVQWILNYLGTRPYAEVAEAIMSIQSDAETVSSAEEGKPADDVPEARKAS